MLVVLLILLLLFGGGGGAITPVDLMLAAGLAG